MTRRVRQRCFPTPRPSARMPRGSIVRALRVRLDFGPSVLRIGPAILLMTAWAGGALSQDAVPAVKRDPKVEAVIAPMLAAYRALNALHEKMSVKADGPDELFNH